MKLNTMTKDERSLLLFLESCSVEKGGIIDTRHINALDLTIAERWSRDNFIQFGRICFKDIEKLNKNSGKAYTHWVTLSKEAWKLASKEREARCSRLYKKRNWKKTSEK